MLAENTTGPKIFFEPKGHREFATKQILCLGATQAHDDSGRINRRLMLWKTPGFGIRCMSMPAG